MPDSPPQAAPGKSMGKAMLMITWLVVLGLLTLWFGRWEERQYNPNAAPESRLASDQVIVTLNANRWHHYVSNGTINGEPVTFLLDTGATAVSVPANLADKLGLDKGVPMQSQTANGTVRVWSTRIDQLTLGAITLTNLRGSINPGMQGDEILLGMSALKQLEIRQQGDTLTLIQRH
ncbi:retropepsin-like aspartic protease family protein [Simiduia agarivorans]|uniref:Aspartic protease n=1 Tax=Simiduia agarivorans (strain DSM 21679 / JCM 13881 / BCRC 17597 / SA1) TaxID=1117647 RepID=K4KNI1_SIMAS|nr:TIGR02281 family clan AA aspartic protease [Simiduia agarivorans]AFV00715.2 aspartic protease [Simiduia agarivorans SA1 = DSM 21679]